MTAIELFEKGLEHLRNKDLLKALACFEKAYTREKTPALQSYYALCIATERGQIHKAIILCNDAIALEPDNPVHYLNLGRVYMKANRKIDAIQTFRKGLSHGDNEEINNILESFNIRKRPVFPFLGRQNLLNKYTGMMLARLKLR